MELSENSVFGNFRGTIPFNREFSFWELHRTGSLNCEFIGNFMEQVLLTRSSVSGNFIEQVLLNCEFLGNSMEQVLLTRSSVSGNFIEQVLLTVSLLGTLWNKFS
jgi:hypothetical protein